MRLLILEDDPQLGKALATGLRQSGHVVDWFRDGARADLALTGESGSGLGVSIVRRIAALHGLALSYHTRADGTGVVAALD